MKHKSTTMQVSPSCSRNKVLIIGDSHVRGLSEKIRNHLNIPFIVSGITKPNADTKSITSTSHFAAENLTEKDLLIFYGGTRDISRNETSIRLKALKAFAHRTIHTNVLLLEAPHRHDLPPFPCVNTEFIRFNKRLHSLATTFNHVKVISIPLDRRFHTNHGLHLNKQGKEWVPSNFVKEIPNLHLPDYSTPPIRLPWRDTNETASQFAPGNQDSIVATFEVQEYLSPGFKNDVSQEHGDGVARGTGNDAQEDETIRRSNRV